MRRTNLAIERHVGKIYTRAMFEQFGHILYECGAYQVEEIEKAKKITLQYIPMQRVGKSGVKRHTRYRLWKEGMSLTASVASLHTCFAATP